MDMIYKENNIPVYTCQTANLQLIPMTPALPSLEHPLTGGGMSSTSAVGLLSIVPFLQELPYFSSNGIDNEGISR